MPDIDRKKTAKNFDEMFSRLEVSGDLHIEVIKIRIAEDIVAALETLDITQAELATRLGTSRSYITQILDGTTNFTLESIARIAQALNCSFEVRMIPLANFSLLGKFLSKAEEPIIPEMSGTQKEELDASLCPAA